jgi:hypothetical protein
MEIDISAFLAGNDAFNYSASAAEMGANAGPITWCNAKAEAGRAPLLTTSEQIAEAKEWLGEFGAWDDDEIASWSHDDVNALVIQYISGNWREIESLCSDDDGGIDWQRVEELESAGTIAGNIFRADDGRIYFYLGN